MLWLGIAAIVFLCDQISKSLILSYFRLGDGRVVLENYFNIVRVHNPGAAFSFMASADGWQRWFFTAIGLLAAVFITVLIKSNATV